MSFPIVSTPVVPSVCGYSSVDGNRMAYTNFTVGTREPASSSVHLVVMQLEIVSPMIDGVCRYSRYVPFGQSNKLESFD